MNEKELVANLLWLTLSEYPRFNNEENKKELTIAAWGQYVKNHPLSLSSTIICYPAEQNEVYDISPGATRPST